MGGMLKHNLLAYSPLTNKSNHSGNKFLVFWL